MRLQFLGRFIGFCRLLTVLAVSSLVLAEQAAAQENGQY